MCRSSIREITLLSSLAAAPRQTVNLAPDIFAARGQSNRLSASPSSQCGLGEKSKLVGSPHFLTSTLSASLLPNGVVLWGMFGMESISSLSSASVEDSMSSSSFMRTPVFCISAMMSSAFFFSLLSCATLALSLLRRALSVSTSFIVSRRLSSNSTALSTGNSPLRPASACFTAWVFSAMYFISSIIMTSYLSESFSCFCFLIVYSKKTLLTIHLNGLDK